MKRQLASQKVKPPLINSESRTTFQNLRAVREEINKYVPDDFRAAFDEIAISGVIKTGDIVTIVRSVMGDEAPLWVVNKFVSLGQEVAKFKTITWNKFRSVDICLYLLSAAYICMYI